MKHPFYAQEYEWDCSLACVLMIASYYQRKKYNYEQIVQKLPYCDDLNLHEIERVGLDYGVIFRSYYVDWANFLRRRMKEPMICQIYEKKSFHFVVLYRRVACWFLIADPLSRGTRWIHNKKLQSMFVGVVLAAEPTIPSIKTEKNPSQLIYWAKLGAGIGATLMTSLVLTGLVIGNQFFFKLLIDEIYLQQNTAIINNWLKAFGLLFLGRLVIGWILKKMVFRIEKDHKQRWVRRFFWKMHWMSDREQRKHSIAWVLESAGQLNELLALYFPGSFMFLQNALILIFSFLIMIWIFPLLALVTILATILITMFGFLINPWKKQMEWELIATNEKFAHETVVNLELRNDCRRRHLTWLNWRKWNYFYDKMQRKLGEKFSFESWQANIYASVRFGTELAIIYLLLAQMESATISAGSFIFIFFLMNNIITYSQALIGYFWAGQRVKKVRPKFNSLLERNVTPGQQMMSPELKQIVIRNLNYEHRLGWKLWKKPISLTFGRHLYLGGAPGSGKTTLMRLISGELKTNEEKQIFWDTRAQETVVENEWQKSIFHVTANSQLMSGGVASNILHFRKRKEDQIAWKDYQIGRWLKKLEINWEAKNNQLLFSSGQRQLIIFLSIFFTDCPLVLIDEGLNSIPPEMKKDLMLWLWKCRPQLRIVYAGHDQQLQAIFAEKFILKNES